MRPPRDRPRPTAATAARSPAKAPTLSTTDGCCCPRCSSSVAAVLARRPPGPWPSSPPQRTKCRGHRAASPLLLLRLLFSDHSVSLSRCVTSRSRHCSFVPHLFLPVAPPPFLSLKKTAGSRHTSVPLCCRKSSAGEWCDNLCTVSQRMRSVRCHAALFVWCRKPVNVGGPGFHPTSFGKRCHGRVF